MLRFAASAAEGNTSIPCPLFPRPTFWPVVKGTDTSVTERSVLTTCAPRGSNPRPYPLVPRHNFDRPPE